MILKELWKCILSDVRHILLSKPGTKIKQKHMDYVSSLLADLIDFFTSDIPDSEEWRSELAESRTSIIAEFESDRDPKDKKSSRRSVFNLSSASSS